MTIKNKKTKQSNQVASSSGASTSVQKSSSSTTSSSTVQKVSSGKKVRYIDVKIEEDDPLMITDVTDHGSVTGSTISEHYNSHPHYIITEAPSMTDLSQTRSLEHHASDMALSKTGEFVSSSVLQESSSQKHTSKSETFQSSSTSVQKSGSDHSQTLDRTTDSSGNQTLNTAFLDSNVSRDATSSSAFLTKSQGANATNSFLQSERQDNVNKQSAFTNQATSSKSDTSKFSSNNHKNTNQRENITHQTSTQPLKTGQTVKSDTSKFYDGEGSIDKDTKTKHFTSTSQSSESKSSSVAKSSSSSYVVEIVDGKERIIDNSHREWGDVKEQASSEAYASVSGTGIKPESAHSIQNYDMKSKYDTGRDGKKPSSEMTIKEDSKFIKDGSEATSHTNYIKEKDNSIEREFSSTQGKLSSKDNQSNVIQDKLNSNISSHDQSTSIDYHKLSNITEEQINSSSQNYSTTTSSSKDTIKTNKSNTKSTDITSQDKRRDVNKTDSSNFYGYDATIQDEMNKVGNILQTGDSKNFNFSTKIMKSDTSHAQQATSSSYRVEIVDGKERIVDTSNREWGDSKEHATYEKSHNVGGTGIKPQHEYTRHVLDKESHYDTGKDGVPTSSNYISEQSALYKDGKEIAYTSKTHGGDFTKKPAITEHFTHKNEDILNRRIQDTTGENINSTSYQSSSTDQNVQSTSYQSTSTDQNVHSSSHQSTSIDQSTIKDSKYTSDFLSTEKQNLTKETASTSTKDTKPLTTYERSTGTWNGKFTYEKDDDRPKKPKDVSPFGRPEQPRHHLKRQDTEENIILSSRDIKDFTSISDLRKIIETTQSNKNVTVSDKSIVINRRTIDDRVLKDIIDTVKKYPFKRIDKVSFGTKINEDVKDLYEGVDAEELTTVVNTTNTEFIKKSFDVQKNKSQVEVTRYIIENGIKTKITTYEDAKEDDKVKTNVFVDKSAMDVTNLVRNLITF